MKTDPKAWLDTVGADTVQTIGSRPTFTIVPRDSGGRRAMAEGECTDNPSLRIVNAQGKKAADRQVWIKGKRSGAGRQIVDPKNLLLRFGSD